MATTYIGIRKVGDEFRLTDPVSEKSATVPINEKLLEILLKSTNADEVQEVLGFLYEHEDVRPASVMRRIWRTFRTENPFWHIQGIITTATMLFGLLYLFSDIVQASFIENYIPLTEVYLYSLANLVIGSFSLYALFKRRRHLKARAAKGLFLLYTYYLIYLSLASYTFSEFQTIVTASFMGISFVLWREWSKPRIK